MKISRLEPLGHYLNLAVFNDRVHRFFERCVLSGFDAGDFIALHREGFVDVHEPLRLGQRLDHILEAIRSADVLHRVCFFFEQPPKAQPLHKLGPRFFDRESLISGAGRLGHTAVLADYWDQANVVAPGFFPQIHLKVSRAVRRSNTQGACAELGVNTRVGDDFNRKRFGRADVYSENLTDKFLVALILRMDRHGRVAQLSLGTSRRNRDRKIRAVLEIIQFPGALDVHQLVIAAGGLAFHRPVDDAVAAVNKALIVHQLENGPDSQVALFVEGVGLPRPVKRRTHFLALGDDGIMRSLRELAHTLQKRLAAEFLFRFGVPLLAD